MVCWQNIGGSQASAAQFKLILYQVKPWPSLRDVCCAVVVEDHF